MERSRFYAKTRRMVLLAAYPSGAMAFTALASRWGTAAGTVINQRRSVEARATTWPAS